MKKVLSLLVAFATAIGVSATAFAAQDDLDNDTGLESYNSYDNTLRFADTADVTYGTSGVVSLAAGQIVLVTDATTPALVMPNAHLDPGKDYRFRIYKSDVTQTETVGNLQLSPVTDDMLGGGKFRLRGRTGTGVISSAKIVKRGTGTTATYRLDITTRQNWGVKLTDVEYLISVTGGTNAAITEGAPTFSVGYRQVPDEDIDAVGEDGILTISNDYPVVKKAQFTELARNANYKAITFDSDDGLWTYIGRVSGMGDTNFYHTRDVIEPIATKLETMNIEYLTFGAGVNFPTHGEMRINAADFTDTFDTFSRVYAYLYRDGKLTRINATYDSGADEIVFRTNYLGSFIITEREITDTTIVDNNVTENPEIPATETPIVNNENPSTGASAGMNVAVALGIVSLAALSFTSRKK